MSNEQQGEQQAQQNLPPARLPEGHQPVNTSVVVRGGQPTESSIKVVRADQHT